LRRRRLVSTAKDYARFARMLLNRGERGRCTRCLTGYCGPDDLESLIAQADDQRVLDRKGSDAAGTWVGYDMAVFNDPARADEVVGKGTFYWEGAAATWFWIDPTNNLVFVGMTQRMYQPIEPPAGYGGLINPRM
jgi:CubicO group peptidase (beta-lactamase class C family)